MKRTLSLILALAMLMSLFTTVSFAAAGDEDNPLTSLTVGVKDGCSNTIMKDGTTTLAYTLPDGALDHSGSVLSVEWESDTVATATINATTGVVTAVAAGTTDITCTVAVKTPAYTPSGGAEVPEATTFYTNATPVTITVADEVSNSYQLLVKGTSGPATAPAVSLVMGTGSGNTYDLVANYSGQLYDKQATPEPIGGATYAYTSNNTAVATVDSAGATITAAGAGSAVIQCTATYKGKTYGPITVATVSVGSTDVTKTVTNGNTLSINDKTMVGEIAAKIDAVNGSGAGAPSLSSVTLTLPTTLPAGFEFYTVSGTTATKVTSGGTVITLDGTDAVELQVKAVAGHIGKCEVTYASAPYTGKIIFESAISTEIPVSVTAPFTKESFSVSLGVSKHQAYTAGDSSIASATGTGVVTINPTSYTTAQPIYYLGYDANNVAHMVTLTVTPVSYDMLSYAEDGGNPFSAAYVVDFAERVVESQNGTNYVYYGDVSNVKFTVPYYNASYATTTAGYALYYGSTLITSGTGLSSAQLDNVTIDVLRAGTYDIPFSCTYTYYRTTLTTTPVTDTIQGIIRVYASSEGDLTYEVSYGDTVTFDSTDFQALYRKLTNNTRTLSRVTVDALPLYGALYSANRTTNAYRVSAGDVFYVSPTGTQNALDYLTYWASTSYTTEYSVYVPVTMYGTYGAAVTAVVEIIINGDVPFVDVAKNSTFYDYIRYCYNHDIMGGKSATRFDAGSSITRAQLVTTLYRMAGSPTTYNSRTLPFTDTAKLSTEFSNAVKWAYYNKIVGGTSATAFSPNIAVTRQAMVKILYGYAKAYGMDTGLVYSNHIGYYTDGSSVSASMKDAMNWALDYGLLSGNGAKLNPRGGTSRGAAAKILANFHANFVG